MAEVDMKNVDVGQGYHTWGIEARKGYEWGGAPAANSAIICKSTRTDTVEANSRVVVVTDFSDLNRVLEIDASVSGSYGGFSGGAKAHFLSSLHLTTNWVMLVVYAQRSIRETCVDAKLNPHKEKNLISDGDVRAFINNHGDSWVRSVRKGGYYIATFTFFCETRETQLEVNTSLSASYSGGVNIDSSFAEKLKQTLATKNTKFTAVDVLVGYGDVERQVLDPSNPDESVKRVLDLTNRCLNTDASKPAPVSFELMGYENAFTHDQTKSYQKVVQNRRRFTGADGYLGIDPAYVQLTQLDNQITQVKTFYDFYGGYEDQNLAIMQAQVKRDISALKKCRNALIDHPTKLVSLRKLTSTKYTPPKPNFEIIDHPGWGYPDHQSKNFCDITVEDILRRTRIAKIHVDFSEGFPRLLTFNVTYQTAAGVVREEKHGSAGHHPQAPQTIELAAGDKPDFINWMTCHWGFQLTPNVLNRVDLTTHSGTSLKTSVESDSKLYSLPDAPPQWSWVEGQGKCLVGFKGIEGSNIDYLEPIIIQFSPVPMN